MGREEELRMRLVARLRQTGVVGDAAVAAALLAVPREAFLPGIPLEVAYEDRALPLKECDGAVLSSISQPAMIAQMLQLLDIRPGDRVLEIGTGSGYNAALLATLVGPAGHIVTIEIEDDLATNAAATLRTLGFANVEVRAGNAETMAPDGSFSRIIVTAREDDIPVAWWDALAERGRIVLPLDIGYGGERVVAFLRHGNRLYSVATQACLFIGMRDRERENSGDMFFRERSLRANARPSAQAPLSILALRRADAKAELLEEADVIIARPTTLFAISLERRP